MQLYTAGIVGRLANFHEENPVVPANDKLIFCFLGLDLEDMANLSQLLAFSYGLKRRYFHDVDPAIVLADH